jgi:hypothetical protein
MGNIFSQTAELARTSQPRMFVRNPVNHEEDLSDRWTSKPSTYKAFVDGVRELDLQWRALTQLRGIDKLGRALERLFGEEVTKRVIEEQAREIENYRSRDELGIRKGSGFITGAVGASVFRVPRTTFYGEKK